MKNTRKISIMMILVILVVQVTMFTGCQNNNAEQNEPPEVLDTDNFQGEDENDSDKNNIKEMYDVDKEKESEDSSDDVVEDIDYVNSWDVNSQDLRATVEYAMPDYTPMVMDMDLDGNLSNIYNIEQFSGFSESQVKELYENKFTVLKPGEHPDMKMHHIYEKSEYQQIPMFITVDSALNMYHLFYDDSLKFVELDKLYNKLGDFNNSMLDKSLKYYSDENYSQLKEELKTIVAYFAVANLLLGEERDLPEEIQAIVEEEAFLIKEADQLVKSPLFNHDIDYSQYTVRGHYTGDEKLERYFRTMMWYGNTAFPLTKVVDGVEILDVDNAVKSMIMASLILEDEDNSSDLDEWEDVYYITALYVGESDDLNVFDYREMITKVYGKNPDLLIYADESYYDGLLEEVKKLPEPQIVIKATEVDIPAGKQFRLMGQRYTLDGEIMQNLMEPLKRPIPSGLDVVAAFGNERAEELLDIYYKPKELWSDYGMKLEELRTKVENTVDETWMTNLYSGWLWILKSAAVSFEEVEGMPEFMKTSLWTDKSINATLGSYAELKHDTVLYTKQPCAEKGGGERELPYHYVEPNIEVYSKLLWQTKNTKENLRVKDLLDEEIEKVLDGMIEMEETLIAVSLKELSNELPTEEEFQKLQTFGGLIDSIMMRMHYLLESRGYEGDSIYTTALVSDVATVLPNSYDPEGDYLELATGFPNEIYVVCSYNGVPYLTKGAVYSYYEFMSRERLTDAKWHEMLGISKELVGDGDHSFYNIKLGEPLETKPDMPEWTNSFISEDENNVKVNTQVKIEWDNIAE